MTKRTARILFWPVLAAFNVVFWYGLVQVWKMVPK